MMVTTPSVNAENIRNSCTQWQIDQGFCPVGSDGQSLGLRHLVKIVINWFLYFLGFIATIFLIYGGFLYVTAMGNDENVNKAKKIIVNAVVGIMLILVAAVLVNALLNMLTKDGADNPKTNVNTFD